MPTLSKAHFSCVYSANLLMKESSFSGMITLLGGWGQQMLDLALPSISETFSFPQPPTARRPHLIWAAKQALGKAALGALFA